MNPVKWVVLATVVLIFSGCASLDKGRDFTAHAPLGLVSVVSNYDINWAGEETITDKGRSASDFVRQTLGLKQDNALVRVSKADGLINEADVLLRQVITGAEVFRLADKDQIVDQAVYSRAGKPANPPKSVGEVAADGYRFIDYRTKGFAAELSQAAEVQSLLYITFQFTKVMVSGIGKNGKFYANVSMTAVMTDTVGKVIYRKTFDTRSSDKIAVTGGAYSQEELMELFRVAIGEACYLFAWDFTGVPQDGDT